MDIKRNGIIALVVVALVLIIDQASKIWVKTTMPLYDSIEIASWFKIYFVENPGMAFGWTFGGEGESGKQLGKLFLSLFRIVAIGFIGFYMARIIKQGFKLGFVICIALIWSGAFGNIIDSVFYGEIFSASYAGHVADFVPLGEGYGSWLHGRVVDMLYFPLIEGNFPAWFPDSWANMPFVFFSPIFNIADSAITVGIFLLLIFYRKELSDSLENKK